MMELFPSPKEGALADINDLALYDVGDKLVLPYGPDHKGSIVYYPEAHYLYATPNAAVDLTPASPYVAYNLRTVQGSCEQGNREDDWVPRVNQILPVLQSHGVDLAGIPSDYPEVEYILTLYEHEESRVELETLRDADQGQWFLGRSSTMSRDGITKRYLLFQFQAIDSGRIGANKEIWRLYARPLGRPWAGGTPHCLQIKEEIESGTSYPMHAHEGNNWGFYGGEEQILKDPFATIEPLCQDAASLDVPPPDIALFRLNENAVARLLKLRIPGSHDINTQPFEREHYALQAALDGLQYIRYDQPAGVAAYTHALWALASRFGEDFFCDAAWLRMQDHLQHLLTPELAFFAPDHTRPYSEMPYLPHRWMRIARTITDYAHPMPEVSYATQHKYGYVAVGKPLFGDTDFWATLAGRLPATFETLADRWLRLPDELPIQKGEAVVHPRALLKQKFPDTYAYLCGRQPRFRAPLGAIAIAATQS